MSSFLKSNLQPVFPPSLRGIKQYDKNQLLQNGLQIQLKQRDSNQPLNNRIHLDYPQIDFYGVKINIQSSIFGVHFYNDSTTRDEISNLKSAEMLSLMYKAERVGGWSNDEIKEYEMQISKFFEE